MSRHRINNTKQPLIESLEYSGPISSALHDNLNIEVEFCDFYAIILQKLYSKFPIKYGDICKALHYIKAHQEPGRPVVLPNYEGNASRFAYVFDFSIIHSVLMYDRFRDMMKKNPSVLKKIFSTSKFNLCILGGGPGFEAIAICMFLIKAIEIFKPETNSKFLIHVTVIDMCAEWKRVVECLFATLQNDLHPLIEVDFCFIKADLTEELTPAIIQAVESSYFVLMFLFVSEVFYTHESEKVANMIKGIVDNMSCDSSLFYLDKFYGGNFRVVNEILNSISSTRKYYGPTFHHWQELKNSTVEKYSFYVQNIFHTRKCCSKITISCSAWSKINNMDQDSDSSPIQKNTVLKKKSEKIEKKVHQEQQEKIPSTMQTASDDLKNSMQAIKEDSANLSSTPLSSFNSLTVEKEFCNFYAVILRKLYPEFQPQYELISKALPSLRMYIVPGTSRPLPDYEDNNLRLAYLYSFSIIHSVIMYDRLREMLEINPTMLKKIMSLKEFNICILGGGPGFEAAGICKLLQNAKAVLQSDTNTQLQIHVTVVDLCPEWETVTECLFTNLQEELQPLTEVDFCYIQADLAKELSPAVKEAIKSSHIVTMFKFISEVCDRYGCENAEKMLSEIVYIMSFKSCLFFLDYAGGGNFKVVDKIIDFIPCMRRLFGPILHHCQELNIDIVRKFSSSLKDEFGRLKCTSSTTISCSSWMKIRLISKKAIQKLDKKISKIK